MKIQFVGVTGITHYCVNAVLRYLQFNDNISKVLVISNEQRHALVLYTECDEIIAVKSGFNSWYNGEGPKWLAYILSLLNEKNIEIEEHDVERHIFEKIDSSCLSESELRDIETSSQGGSDHCRNYIYNAYSNKEILLERFPSVIPFFIIDP